MRRPNVRNCVLDASAVLALLFEEQGADAVEEALDEAAVEDRPALITAVNWAEVLYRVHRKRGEEGLQKAREFERAMPLEVAAADREMAEQAARYKTTHSLPLADAFAAALARHRKARLLTSDPDFKPLDGEIKIGWLR